MEETQSTPIKLESTQKEGNPTAMIVAGVVALLIIGGVVLAATSVKPSVKTEDETMKISDAKDATQTEEKKAPEAMVGDKSGSDAAMMREGEVKTFTIQGKNFAFSPKEMRVKKGDTVKITFKNTQGFHDFLIDEFGIKTKQIAVGASEDVTFVADKTGTFEYYCSVGSHRQNGMVGKLIVE